MENIGQLLFTMNVEHSIPKRYFILSSLVDLYTRITCQLECRIYLSHYAQIYKTTYCNPLERKLKIGDKIVVSQPQSCNWYIGNIIGLVYNPNTEEYTYSVLEIPCSYKRLVRQSAEIKFPYTRVLCVLEPC